MALQCQNTLVWGCFITRYSLCALNQFIAPTFELPGGYHYIVKICHILIENFYHIFSKFGYNVISMLC